MRNRWIYLGMGILCIYIASQACQSEGSIRIAQYAINGKKLYETDCSSCHGAKGEGLGKLYPPLTDSSFLISHREQLACIVKNGLHGTMPPNPQLASVEIAYILTYVGNSFGNDLGIFTQEEIEDSLAGCK